MDYSEYNPIRSVDGKAILAPFMYQWNLEDVSASDAGRTEDTRMQKKRLRQVVSLELSWSNLTTKETNAILQAFNPEYIQVCYLSPLTDDYITAEFYVGNRSVPLRNARTGTWSNLSFNIIER